jgi:hypothetical protein
MRTWGATFIISIVICLFGYVTFIKENPVSGWWWFLGVFLIIQVYLHDAVEDYTQDGQDEDEDVGEQEKDSKQDE